MTLESKELESDFMDLEKGDGDAKRTTELGKDEKSPDNQVEGSYFLEEGEKIKDLKEETHVEVDGFYGWVVVVASFLSCFMVGTMFIAFSILYLEFVDYFHAERGVTGWIGSLYLATGNICGVGMSLIIEYRGCRFLMLVGSVIWMSSFALSSLALNIPYLYFTYGVLGGLGFNMVTLASFVIVQKHFQRHRSLAAGLSASGISIGSLVSGPLIGFFISTYGWRGALLIMSGMAFNCCVFGCFYRPPRIVKTLLSEDGVEVKKVITEDEKQKSHKAPLGKQVINLLKGMADVSLFKNPRFQVICMTTFFFNFGASIFYQHTPSRAVSFGVDRKSAYFIQTIVGILTLMARIIGASVGNAKCTDRILQYGFSVMMCGVSLSATGLSDIYETICLVAGCTGFCSGLVMTIQTTVLTDIVGVAKVHRAQALLLVFMGVGALIGVPLAGLIYDRTRNYNLPFYIGGGMQIFGGIAMVVTHLVMKRLTKTESDVKLSP